MTSVFCNVTPVQRQVTISRTIAARLDVHQMNDHRETLSVTGVCNVKRSFIAMAQLSWQAGATCARVPLLLILAGPRSYQRSDFEDALCAQAGLCGSALSASMNGIDPAQAIPKFFTCTVRIRLFFGYYFRQILPIGGRDERHTSKTFHAPGTGQ